MIDGGREAAGEARPVYLLCNVQLKRIKERVVCAAGPDSTESPK